MKKERFIGCAVLLGLMFMVYKQWENREMLGIIQTKKRIDSYGKKGVRDYSSEQIKLIMQYSEPTRSVEIQNENDFTGFYAAKVGVWNPQKNNLFGAEFLYLTAVKYFHVNPANSSYVQCKDELKSYDYVITPWDSFTLTEYGFTEVSSEGFVYVYKNMNGSSGK